jgi:DNA modification methylase
MIISAQQLSLFREYPTRKKLVRHTFSHGGVCPENARLALEKRYGALFEETDRFNRQLVSFQANKTETLHSWLKYREGFSTGLVEALIEELGLTGNDRLLDPFAGSATTLLTAKMLGIDAVGVELLPHCQLAWEAKSQAFEYDLDELRLMRRMLEESDPSTVDEPFPHLLITESAFPPEVEERLMAYDRWLERLDLSSAARAMGKFLLMTILEEVSYTRKDGQYLRWDGRAAKIIAQNQKRAAQGKKTIQGIDKGALPDVKQLLLEKLNRIIIDIGKLQREAPPPSQQSLIAGNTLYTLPTMAAEQFAAVITSPPYANRYDYTRTYALELAYLGVAEEIFNLRQNQLSCTVENKSKEDKLAAFYASIGASERYERIMRVVRNDAALNEINAALAARNKRGDVNNRGVLNMIRHYFTELTFVFAELHRVCRPGAAVVFVNDNVRYAGEVIPVDALSGSLAEQVGFVVEKIYVLPQRKGNSSQQMGKFGREPLRKSITIWRKPGVSL